MSEADSVVKLSIKVVPGSSQERITGWLGDSLKVRVKSPAERGRANSAVVNIIATALGVPANNVHLATGKTSSRKVIEITGLAEAEVYKRLSRAVSDIHT